MTGLYALQTALVVNGTSVFHNNTGIDGGGLTYSLYRNSYTLYFHENSILNFTNNTAQRGGAIFVDDQPGMQDPCFFQYSDYTNP